MWVKGRSNRLIPIWLLGKIGKFQERLIFMLLWHNQTPSIYSYQLDIFSTILDLILVNIWACKQKVECSIQFTPMWIPVIFPHKTSIMLGKKLRYLASRNILVIYRLFSAVRYQQYYPSLMFQSNTNNNGSVSNKTSINAFYLSDKIQCWNDLLSRG